MSKNIKTNQKMLELVHEKCFKRSVGIDVLKIYAIVMVVLTHCYAPSYVQMRLPELWIYNAVPIFLIIGSFLYSRKFVEMCAAANTLKEAYSVWLGKQNVKSFFKRIGIPYLCFMILQLIVLPLVGYAPFQEVLLNTIKGGMGPGGYYLVVYLQLFLLTPALNRLFNKSQIAAFALCFIVQLAVDCIMHYLSLNVSAIFTDINKYVSLRFLTFFICGIAIRNNYFKISNIIIDISILFGFLVSAVRYIDGLTGIYVIDSASGIIQGLFWCGGIVCMVMKLLENCCKESKCVKFVAASTLHILLFQQLYFCCVGTARHIAYIDAPIALLGGMIAFIMHKQIANLSNKILVNRKDKK